MKKSIKKYLLLAIVAVMLLATIFAVSAVDVQTANCPTHGPVDPVRGLEHPVQCNADGYTELVCPICYKYLGINTDVVKATNHTLEWDYVNKGTHYEYVGTCTNYQNFGCTYTETKTYDTENHPAVKYYKVIFRNAFTTAATLDSCKYTEVAVGWKDTVIAEKYVEENTFAACGGASRDKDVNFGAYKFLGWASAEKIPADSTAYNAFNACEANLTTTTGNGTSYNNPELRKFIYGENGSGQVYMKSENTEDPTSFKVPVAGEAEKADYTVYAIFDVKAVDAYKVVFYDVKGREIDATHYETLGYNLEVNHGGNLSANNGKVPDRDEDEYYTYSFTGWVKKEDHSIHVDLNAPVYGDINLQADYAAVPRTYVFKYYYRDGTEIKIGDKPVTDTVTIAPDENGNKETAKNGLKLNKINSKEQEEVYNKLFKYSDLVYDYVFTGKWIISGLGRVIDLNNPDLTDILDFLQTDGGIVLTPQYRKIERLYPLVVRVKYIEDYSNSHPDEVVLTLKNDDGFYTADTISFKDTDNVYYNNLGEPYYEIEYFVPFSETYTILASAGAYGGSTTKTFHNGGYQGTATVELTRVGRDDCSCVCHSILKPIWIKVLNLLNTLFKLKVVCCDDMYANIGGDLNYKA